MTDILPTHHCFDDTIELMGEFVNEDKFPTLVHAICLADDGTPYAHAWVEEGGLVWDSGLVHGQQLAFAVPQLDYYAAKRVQRRWHYAFRDMLRMNRAHGTYGPWEPELLALCRSDPRVLGRIPATYTPTRKDL